MLALNEKRLRELVRDVLLGKDTDGLSVMIKGPEILRDEFRPETPVTFERRRVDTTARANAVVGFPEKRLIKPSSRSPLDYWTIIYKGSVIAEGQFHELEKSLSDIPKQILSYSLYTAKQIVLIAGGLVVMGVCVLAGFGVQRILVPRGARETRGAQEDARAIAKINSSLATVLERQGAMESLLLSGVTGYGLQAGAVQEAPSQEAETKPAVEKDFASTFQARINEQLEEMELRQLLDLEQKKSSLILRDKELEDQGCLPLHTERRAIATARASIDRQIDVLKRKFAYRAVSAERRSSLP